jgi:hypothetical protein
MISATLSMLDSPCFSLTVSDGAARRIDPHQDRSARVGNMQYKPSLRWLAAGSLI